MGNVTRHEVVSDNNMKCNQASIYPAQTTHINGTIKHSGPFYAITALEDAVIDVSECDVSIIEFNSGTKRAIETDFTVPKGVTIYADFQSIELDSGAILAYSKGIAGEHKEPTADDS